MPTGPVPRKTHDSARPEPQDPPRFCLRTAVAERGMVLFRRPPAEVVAEAGVIDWFSMPNRDIQWVIGTMVVLAGLVVWRVDAGFAAVNVRMDRLDTRMDRIEARMDRIEARLDGLDERLRNVEIAFGKVDQRLLTIERVVLPAQGR